MTRPAPAALATSFAVLTALALAGCGSSGGTGSAGQTASATTAPAPSASATAAASAPAAAAGTDACSLITAADITAAEGVALAVQGPAQSIGNASECTWGSDTQYVQVEVGDSEVYKVASSSSTTQLAGPWDKGSYYTASTGTSLTYLKGSVGVALQVVDLTGTVPDIAHVTALATATAGRI